MGDRLTPDEMKAAGLDYVTPAESRGHDNGPRTPRMVRQGVTSEHPLPPRERSTFEEDRSLGLETGPIKRDLLHLPGFVIAGGDWGPTPIGDLEKEQRTGDISDTVGQVQRLENAAGDVGLSMVGGGLAAKGVEAALAPAVVDAAGAARMGSSAAMHAAMHGTPATASSAASVLPLAAKLLMGHSPYMKAAQMAAKAIPAVSGAARAAAPPLAAAGAGAAGGAAAVMPEREQESPEQRIARILMQGISEPEFK